MHTEFENQEQIETTEFTDFLFLYGGVYAASIQVMDFDSNSGQAREPAELADFVLGHLCDLEVSAVTRRPISPDASGE